MCLLREERNPDWPHLWLLRHALRRQGSGSQQQHHHQHSGNALLRERVQLHLPMRTLLRAMGGRRDGSSVAGSSQGEGSGP